MEKEKKGGLYFAGGLLSGIAITSMIVVFAYVMSQSGINHNSQQTSAKYESTIDVEVAQGSMISKEFLQKVATLESMIKDTYYLDEVDTQELREGAYEGIVNSLGDVYSVYYTPEETEEILNQSEGVYYGIGAYCQLDTVSGYVKVTGTIANTPAEEAGLMPGDLLYMVEGEDMAGLDLTQVVTKIKGEEGTKVHLTLVRDGEYVEVDVERRKIESPTVQHSMLEDNMAYIQLTEFDDVSVEQFRDALNAVKAENAQGMILDLRGNPGGNLSTVLEIADMLLDEGMIVYIEDKSGKQQKYYAKDGMEWELPIVVLVDGNSASASEVLSGALKDHKRATLVGTTTFGKGIVQSLRSLADGSSVKLTVSAYYTPNGINVHGTGIEPDVVEPFDAESYYGEANIDNQLEKAKEVLKDLLEQ